LEVEKFNNFCKCSTTVFVVILSNSYFQYRYITCECVHSALEEAFYTLSNMSHYVTLLKEVTIVQYHSNQELVLIQGIS